MTETAFLPGQKVTFEVKVSGKWHEATGKTLFFAYGEWRIVGRANGKRVQIDTKAHTNRYRNLIAAA